MIKVENQSSITAKNKIISFRFLERWAYFSEKDGRQSYYVYDNVQEEFYFDMNSHLKKLLSDFVPNSELNYHKINKPQLVNITNPFDIPLLDPKTYTLDHSGTILLVNPNGELTAVFSMPHDANKIAADYIRLQ